VGYTRAVQYYRHKCLLYMAWAPHLDVTCTSSREVAALVSLFFIHVSKLYKRTKWPVWLKMVRAVVRICSRRSQSEIHRRLVSVYGQNVFSRKEVFVWCNKFKDVRTALNDDPQKHRGRSRILVHWWKLYHCRRCDKGRLKSQISWNCWSDRYCKKHSSWNHLRFKLL
jgi:hypothetical protein